MDILKNLISRLVMWSFPHSSVEASRLTVGLTTDHIHQEFPQNDRLVLFAVVGRIKEGDLSFLYQVKQRLHHLRMAYQFGGIPALESVPRNTFMVECPAQLMAGCGIFQPQASAHLFPAQPSRPDPVNQHPITILRSGILIHPLMAISFIGVLPFVKCRFHSL